MSRKMKILISILVPVVLLAVGGVSFVLAADGTSPGSANVTGSGNVTPIKGLLPRVAVILGIPEQTLTDAFKKADQQIKDEAFLKDLDKAVASGRMTQDEANKLKAWWQQRPDVANRGFAPFARIFAKRGGLRLPPPGIVSGNVTGIQGPLPRVAAILGIPLEKLESAMKQAQQEMQADAFLKTLDKAVEKGLITQAEADQIKQWWQQRPEVANRMLQQLLRGRPQFPRHMMRGAGGRMPGLAMPQGMGGGMMGGGTW